MHGFLRFQVPTLLTTNVIMTIIPPPPHPRTCFAIRAYGKGGGFSTINDGVAVGLGSAARSSVAVLQVKESLIKSGYFGPEQYTIATPLLLLMDLK